MPPLKFHNKYPIEQIVILSQETVNSQYTICKDFSPRVNNMLIVSLIPGIVSAAHKKLPTCSGAEFESYDLFPVLGLLVSLEEAHQ